MTSAVQTQSRRCGWSPRGRRCRRRARVDRDGDVRHVAGFVNGTGFFTPLHHIASLWAAPEAMTTSMEAAMGGNDFRVSAGPWTKSSAGYRTLFLPPFAVGILLRRQVENHANPYGAVFPTRRGTWRQVSNWERMWNQVVDDTAYDWVTFHTFRRSVATLIDREVGIDAVQAQLRRT